MGCKTRKYSDGGKVLEREYGAGQPTYLKSVMAKVGIGDGYGKAKPKRMNVGNATETIRTVASNRKKMLDDI
jgi:hypothetical protein